MIERDFLASRIKCGDGAGARCGLLLSLLVSLSHAWHAVHLLRLRMADRANKPDKPGKQRRGNERALGFERTTGQHGSLLL